VRGRIAGDGALTVEGHVEGDVALRGELTVAEGGEIHADTIEAEALVVSGVVEGELRVSGVVRAMAGSRVRGNVTGGASLALDDGAQFAGRIDAEFDLPAELLESSGGSPGRRR